MATHMPQQLLEVLRKIDRPGKFCTSGRLPSLFPGLEVDGPIALPLGKQQATALRKLARQAPYGKGTRTVVDTDVRRVWEIDADRVRLANSEWPALVEQAIEKLQSDLGLKEQQLTAHLYKLLLYEPGSFFLPHRDGEKIDRMVATLVIALPSEHAGGELIVRHDGQEEVVDFGPDSPFHTQFAAFYADCEHEIRPVTSGFRLALVYNLVLEKSQPPITAPTSSTHVAAAVRVLNQWDDWRQTAATETAGSTGSLGEDQDDTTPSKLAVLLEHQYSQEGLTYETLKGIDRAKADMLFEAARQAGYDASLALVTYWVNGAAEPSGNSGYSRSRRYGRYDDDYDEDEDDGPHEMGEIYDESCVATHFSDQQGNRLGFGELPLQQPEIVSDVSLNEGTPTREDYEGYTGNAGMTLERWYHRAAVILWPTESRFDALRSAGMEAAASGLALLVEQWNRAGKTEQAVLKQQCVKFADRMIAHWPERKYLRGHYRRQFSTEVPGGASAEAPLPTLPEMLETLRDASLVSSWIRGVLPIDVTVEPGKTLGNLCKQHGWLTFQEELRNLFSQTTNETLRRHANLLADLSLRKDRDADRKSLCAMLAQQMMTSLQHWIDERERDWKAAPVDLSTLLPPLVQSFVVLEETSLLNRLVANVLDRPKVFDLTKVQVPAIVHLQPWLKRNVKHSCKPLHRWLTAVHHELKSRATSPPQKPADWRRKSDIPCTCGDCLALSRFLDDPHTETLRLPLAKKRRQHLHNVIEHHKLDTTHVTEHRGNPHALVCTKTCQSYDRALQSHQVDLDHFAKIDKLRDWHQGLPSVR